MALVDTIVLGRHLRTSDAQLGGAVRRCTWPGTGFLLGKAILTRDIPMLQGALLVLALCFVAINLIVDLLQTAVIRVSSAARGKGEPWRKRSV